MGDSPTAANLAADFNVTDERLAEDPHSVYAVLREKCPVARSEHHGGYWVLSKFDDVHDAATNHGLFSSADGVTVPATTDLTTEIYPLHADPPIHAKYRAILQPMFSPGRVAQLEPQVRAVVSDLVDAFIDRGTADLAAELAEPLPPIVIGALLGLPREDWSTFRDLQEETVRTAGVDEEANHRSNLELASYVGAKLDERRRSPQDDILTKIVTAKVDGELLTDIHALGMTLLLLAAGFETTVGALGFMLYHVAVTPGVKEKLIADPARRPMAIEEALRMEPPLQYLARTLTADTSIRGVEIPKGSKVLLSWASANLDQEAFPDPETFKLDRSNNRHMGFGAGIHRCVGAPLARLEMRAVLDEVLARIPDYRLSDNSAVITSGLQARAIRSLPVVW